MSNLRNEIEKIIEVYVFCEDRQDCTNDILALIEGQRCEWTWDDGYDAWKSSCGSHAVADSQTFDFDKNPFCPCCGRKIEVKNA